MSEKMNTLSWVRDAVFYQIFPDRFANGDKSNDPVSSVPWNTQPTRENYFGGDLQGIINNLDYLQDLGINALYLTPIFKAKSNHKYDVCDYLLVDPAFGNNDTLRDLVSSAHKRDIHVVLDAVFNHCGYGFWAFQDVVKNGSQSQFVDWFQIESFPIITNPPSYQTAGGAWYLPKLNTDYSEVRRYLSKVSTYWIEKYSIDGWRLDVPWKVPKDYWVSFRGNVKRLNPEVYIVGEFWRDFNPWIKGDTCDGVMNYALRDYMLDYCVHHSMDAEDFSHYINRQREDFGTALATCLNLVGSHDTPRILTLCKNDPDVLKIIYAFLFTYIGAPTIFYGDELGIRGMNDPDCRQPMEWDCMNWNEDLRNNVKKLIKLRRDKDVLRMGKFESLKVLNGVFAYKRFDSNEEIFVIINPSESSYHHFPLRTGTQKAAKRTWIDYLSNNTFLEQNGEIIINDLKNKSAMIILHDKKR